MTKENLLSVSDIARELNAGKATIKFLLKRFKKYIPGQNMGGQYLYPVDTIKILCTIQEKIDAGILPSAIEEELNSKDSSFLDPLISSLTGPLENGDIRLSNDGLTLLKSVFSDIGEQQKRIANAHEKRAQAEERKAVAIENRAIAEEKKAAAMNNIASALQEMNQIRSSDASAQQIVHQAASIIANDEISADLDKPDNIDASDKLSDIDELPNINELSDTDISSLLEEDKLLSNNAQDDLMSESSDLEFDKDLEDVLSDPLEETEENFGIGDLSSLLDEESSTDDMDEISSELGDLSDLDDLAGLDDDLSGLDDLADLIEDSDSTLTEEMEIEAPVDLPIDDLSKLISDPDENIELGENIELDDLSALIDQKENKQNTGSEDVMDDLSKLIDSTDEPKLDDISLDAPSQGLDDLSKLIDSPKGSKEGDLIIDDLSALIDQPKAIEADPDEESIEEPVQEQAPAIKIDLTPEDDLEKYKAAVMKVIIGLKEEGLSVKETTERLNRDQIKTLSGKSKWGDKAIGQVYKFIDSAK